MTRTIAETEYLPAYVETVRVVNVNIQDWSIDCVSDKGGKRYFDIQVMSPYFHYSNGEGIYAMPEVGAMAWICIPSEGRFAAPFLLGFMAPFEQNTISFRSGRQSLNPGDIMIRTRDENFIAVRRGGVVQIGATPIAQRMFIPVGNLIKDFCENYSLDTFGGSLHWITEREETTTDGSAPTRLTLKVKEKANDPGHIVEAVIGSHEQEDATTLDLVVRASGAQGAETKARFTLTKEGEVTWDLRKSWSLVVAEEISMATESGNMSFSSGKDLSAEASGNLSLSSGGNVSAEAGVSALISGALDVTVDAPVINLGKGAVYPAVNGAQLAIYLVALNKAISAFPALAAVSALDANVPNVLSTKTFLSA